MGFILEEFIKHTPNSIKKTKRCQHVTDWIGNTRKLTNYAQKSPWTLL